MLFERVLLIDLRQMLSRFDPAQFSALVQSTEPSQLILRVLKAVIILVKPEPITDVERCNWCRCLTVCLHFIAIYGLARLVFGWVSISRPVSYLRLATQVNSAWPSIREQVQSLPAKVAT